MTRAVATVVLEVLAIAFVASGAAYAAEWYRDYENGVRAVEAGRYREAIPLLESARSSGTRPGHRVRYYGQRYGEFYPYVYLGTAYLSIGDCENAVRMFQTSLQFEERDLYENREQLVARGCSTASSTTSTVAPPTSSSSSSTSSTTTTSARPTTTTTIERTSTTPTTAATTTTPAPPTEPLQAAWAKLDAGLIDEACIEAQRAETDSGLLDSDAELMRFHEALVGKANALTRDAALLLLQGNRGRAIESFLQAQCALSGRANYHLFLSLAYFGTHLEADGQELELVEKARASASRALAIDPALEPDRRFFSPRFVAWFEELRANRP